MDKSTQNLWKKRVKELISKGMFDPDQQQPLNAMIESPDTENAFVVEEVIGNMIREKLSIGLNLGQQTAYNTIVDFLKDQIFADAIVLKGYAGTGKTFLVKKVIEYMLQTNTKKRVAVSAPTNKAVTVLFKNSAANSSGEQTYIFEDIFNSDSRLVYSTTHKLLGLKETITDDGQQIFTADSLSQSELSDYDYLIVDEISMLDDSITDDIMKYKGRLKIIFLGDPCQIPPINRDESMPFRKQSRYKFKVIELDEIMRQTSDNPIIEASFLLRNNLQLPQPILEVKTKVNSKGNGIIAIDSVKDKTTVRPLLATYFKDPKFTEDSDYMKVIAWTNKTVNYVNSVVREILHGVTPAKFIVGEKLVVGKPIFEKVKKQKREYYDSWRIVFNTSEELTVEGISITEKTFTEANHKLTMTMYQLHVAAHHPQRGKLEQTIYVVHEESAVAYQALVNLVKSDAVKYKQARLWVNYFNILKWSSNVSYNYAISAHKSQGSTYNNTFIMEDDIDLNKKIVERNKIKYTSYTRASEKLFIFKKVPIYELSS